MFMKKMLFKLIVVFLLVLLSACSKQENYPEFMDIEIGKTSASELNEMGYVFDIPEVLSGNQESHSDYLLFQGINIGSINFKNNNENEIESSQATISYLEVYVDIYPEYLFIEDVMLAESIKENCKVLKGKYKEGIGNSCVIEKEDIVYILESNIAKDWDKLNRIEIFGR